jgi:hypothetical protein
MASGLAGFLGAQTSEVLPHPRMFGPWDAGSLLAHSGDPAGGTPLADLVPASIVAAVALAGLVALAIVYRRGDASWLRRLAAFSERVSGIPGWAALPAAIGGGALVVAVFGFYWDVATHIDNGRDAGPFANPSHFFILAGLAGITVAGYVAVLIGTHRPTTTSVRLADDWHAPVGGLLLLLCGVVALAGFPLDDVWHRLFGQDVTLWGPTHIQMIGGASLSTLAVWALLREAGRHNTDGDEHRQMLLVRYRDVLLGGALLLGLSTLQGEFDYGVPQFSLLYHPVLLMVAAGIGLVAARLLIGPGGALASVAFFLVMRGVLALLVAPVLGRSLLHFPLFLVEALIVEAVALRIPRDRQISLGAAAGVLIGTLGLAAEWGWSHVWMPLPWPRALLPEAVVAGFAAALAAGTLGGFIGRALSPRTVNRQSVSWLVPAAAVFVVVACLTYPGITSSAPDVQATVELQDNDRAGTGWVDAVVRLDPPDAARDALWFEVLAWQGREWQDGGLVRVNLDNTDAGVYRTARPFPVHGEWKAVVRLHRDRWLQALPIYLPEDPGIPADGVPAEERFTREFVSDKELLQREAQAGSATLQAIGYLLLLTIAAVWLAAIAWGLHRINRGTSYRDEPEAADRAAAVTAHR